MSNSNSRKQSEMSEMTEGEAFLRSLEQLQDETIVPQRHSTVPDAGKDEESFLAALEQAVQQEEPLPVSVSSVKPDKPSDEESFLRALEQAVPQEGALPVSVSPSKLDKSSDEESFLRALEQAAPQEAPAHVIAGAGSMAKPSGEEAFLHALEQVAPQEAPSNVAGDSAAVAESAGVESCLGSLEQVKAQDTSDVASDDVQVVSFANWQPLQGKMVSKENASLLKQLNEWLQQCPEESGRFLAYLAVFCRFESDIQNDVFYIVLRELGRALCDCLNRTVGSSSDVYETLKKWSCFIKGASPLSCQLKIPYPGGATDLSWMHSRFSSSVVSRICTWAVTNQDTVIYPAEIE